MATMANGRVSPDKGTARCKPFLTALYEKFLSQCGSYDGVLILQAGHGTDAIKSCTDLLDMDPDSIDGLCDRAEAHIANENYDGGMYTTASL